MNTKEKTSQVKIDKKIANEIIDYYTNFYFLKSEKDSATNFLTKLFNGEIKINVIQVGCDFPTLVPSSNHEALISFLNREKIYDTIAHGEKISSDITQKTIDAIINNHITRKKNS